MNLQQTPFRSTRSALACAAVLASLGAVSTSTYAAPSADERAEIEATYQSERQACLDGNSSQPRAACLDEARSVRRDALSGASDNWAEPDYAANAMMRCDIVPVDAYADCIRRTQGEGTEVGSVEEGAILRELPPVVTAAAEVEPEAQLMATAQTTASTETVLLDAAAAPAETMSEPVAALTTAETTAEMTSAEMTSAETTAEVTPDATAMPDVGTVITLESETALEPMAAQQLEAEQVPAEPQAAAVIAAPVQPLEQGGTPD